MGRCALYSVHGDFWAAFAADSSGTMTLDGVSPLVVEPAWFVIAACQFSLEICMLCICVLLDTKHHTHTGRKFYVAEPSASSEKKLKQ